MSEESTASRVVTVNKHLSRRLQRRISLLPKHVQHNFVWSSCRDNVHAIAQLFTLLRQIPDNVEASSTEALALHVSQEQTVYLYGPNEL